MKLTKICLISMLLTVAFAVQAKKSDTLTRSITSALNKASVPYSFATETAYEPEVSPIYGIMERRPIVYFIEIDDLDALPLDAEQRTAVQQKLDTLPTLIENTFTMWQNGIKEEITSSGRSGEFKDILKILRHPIKLKGTNKKSEAHVIYKFTTPEKIDAASAGHDNPDSQGKASHMSVGTATGVQHTITLPLPGLQADNELLLFCLHETGHFLGLDEQYADTNGYYYVARPDYYNPRYNQQLSVMDATGYALAADKTQIDPRLGCDDVDGIINLFDYMQFRAYGKFPERAQKGWISFCGSDSYYRNAKPYIANYCWLDYDKQGLSKDPVCPDPFVYEKREFSFDARGLLRYMIDKKNGWLFAYSYFLTNPACTVTVKSLDGSRPDMKVNVVKNLDTWVVPYQGKMVRFYAPTPSKTSLDTLEALREGYPIYKSEWEEWPKTAPYDNSQLQISLSEIQTFPADHFPDTFLHRREKAHWKPLFHLQKSRDILMQSVADSEDKPATEE